MKTVTIDTMALRDSVVVTVAQPVRGHRFTLDSLLLADFCRIRPRDHVLDPGSGTGIVSLLLASRNPRITVTAMELDPEAADLCRWNSHVNGLADRIQILQQDIRTIGKRLRPELFDAIVANPPYVRSGAGRQSPFPGRRSARQDAAGELSAWTGLGKYLRNGGRYFLVFTAARTADLLSTLRQRKLEPKRIRMVHTRPGRPASLVLVEAIKSAAPGAEILSPLIVHGPDGTYSAEVQQLYVQSISSSPETAIADNRHDR